MHFIMLSVFIIPRMAVSNLEAEIGSKSTITFTQYLVQDCHVAGIQ